MLETAIYAKVLERKLIREFRKTFFEKTGKRLIISVERPLQGPGWMPYMDLGTLDRHITGLITDARLVGKVKTLAYRSRIRQLVYLRTIFCKIARMLRFTTTEIGSYLGIDHSTVIHCTAQDRLHVEAENEDYLYLYKKVMLYLKNLYDEPAAALEDTGAEEDYAEPVGIACLP